MIRNIKTKIKELAAYIVDTDEVHESLSQYCRRAALKTAMESLPFDMMNDPYACKSNYVTASASEVTPIFITSRFRSGSTALWSAFRKVHSVAAYYEPFNERRFFDRLRRGDLTDKSHIGVTDYWREYDGLCCEDLVELYSEDWIRRELYMDRNSWAPEMKEFISTLVAGGSFKPVLQFNRVDFRLDWLKYNFPDAIILHIYRNPREQWCSTLGDISEFPFDANAKFFRSRFYCKTWARDLQHVFPVLQNKYIQHPYERSYLLWRLSYAFGKHYSNYSFSFESLVSEPNSVFTRIAEIAGIEMDCIQSMASTIVVPSKNRWPSYAPESWFIEREKYCEGLLAQMCAK